MSETKLSVGHVPVMLSETLSYMVPPAPGCLLIDATQGLAGHSIAFLDKYPLLRLLGVDADSEVQAIAKARLEPYSERATFVNSYFDDFFSAYKTRVEEGVAERPGLVLFDFGLSMYHFRESGRGFSLQGEEPLDMRLGSSLQRTAADLVNELDERELLKVLVDYGEDPFAYKIMQAIARERRAAKIETTDRLADIVRGAVPPKFRYGRIHPATRTFQALRIAVNDELGRIERGLADAIACLAPDGVIACISFHSLEDRIVKLAFRKRAIHRERAYFKEERESPIPKGEAEHGLVILTKRPVEPSDGEVSSNPASRSAKLRIARATGGSRP
jgi:16S rRNA (cytosine1402-N4)-methyltransferase